MNPQLPVVNVDPDKIRSLDRAKKAINQLLNTFEKLASQVQRLIVENERLKQENERLRKQSKRPLFKSRKPKPADYSAPKGLEPTLKQGKKSKKKKKIIIDREEILPEVELCSCGGREFKYLRTWDKIVQGIEIKRNNTRYLGKDKRCLNCGQVYKSIIPEEIKGKEFDSRLATWISVLKHDCRFSELLIFKFLTSLGIIISRSQINNILLRNSEKLKGAYSYLKSGGIDKSRYLHSDATGSKRRVKSGEIINQHLHFAGHQFLSLFKVTTRYNSEVLNNQVLGKKAKDKLYLSDDAGANQRVKSKDKQLCWIHEIRHYLKLDPWTEVNKKRLKKVIGQLWCFYGLAKEYNKDPTQEKRNNLVKQFTLITGQKTGYDVLDKRLILTGRKRDKLLLFLNYPGLPIQNNLAERDLRPAVIIRKLSGGTKSKEGDRSFERHLSIIQTAGKQGLNVFETLHGLLTNQLNPSVLTVKTTPRLKPFT